MAKLRILEHLWQWWTGAGAGAGDAHNNNSVESILYIIMAKDGYRLIVIGFAEK